MKNISKFYDSVEIGSHPTIENPGKGLGIKCFSDRDLYSTLFIAFGKKYETIEASNSSEYDILEIPFNHLPLRTKTSSIGKVYRIVLKTMVISSFIVRALFSLRGVHYKLINIHSLMLLPLLIFVGRKKKVITFRGSDFDFFKKSKIMRLMALVCDEFHCVSYAQCAFLEQHFKKRITIINNMVDVRFFESPMTQSRLNKKNLIDQVIKNNDHYSITKRGERFLQLFLLPRRIFTTTNPRG